METETVNNRTIINRLSKREKVVLYIIWSNLGDVPKKQLRRRLPGKKYVSHVWNRYYRTTSELSPTFVSSLSRTLKRLRDRGMIKQYLNSSWYYEPHVALTQIGFDWVYSDIQMQWEEFQNG